MERKIMIESKIIQNNAFRWLLKEVRYRSRKRMKMFQPGTKGKWGVVEPCFEPSEY